VSRGTDARYGRQGGRLEPFERRRQPAPTGNRHPLAGLVCTCPPGCTDKAWCDAGRCDPHCKPCHIMTGKPYSRADLPGAGAKADQP
jgi:hypothetical protein